MLMILGLTILGFAMIVVDLLFIPGGILIAVGSVGILYSVWLNYQEYGLIPAVIHLALSLAAVPKLVTWSLDKVSLKNEMHVEDGYVGVKSHSNLIGNKGSAMSDLRPSGKALIQTENGEVIVDCIADSGYIDKGDDVEVFEERGPSLVVRRIMT